MTVSTEKKKPLRVMWLLNHSSARHFEGAMLKKIGIAEIFHPKSFPTDPGFRSASVDYSDDAYLTIPADELQILNDTDWYGTPSKRAWKIANRYFDILFFVLLDYDCFKNIIKNFKGAILYRAYGVIKESVNYANVLYALTNGKGAYLAKSVGNRFWYCHAYEHQSSIERGLLHERALYLPLGLVDTSIEHNTWTGEDKRIFFVCPDIELLQYYKSIYQKFICDFAGFSYVIAGAQAIEVPDPNVLGYVSKEEHERNMRSMRVMFYHSDEPQHIHYHPFEAIRAGMPLIFMANGLLDYIGGNKLAGRCKTITEARKKIERIMNDDWDFIEEIRSSQAILLEQMAFDYAEKYWRQGIQRVQDSLFIETDAHLKKKQNKISRIAVIIPIKYSGGTLRGAKLLAQAIELGGNQDGKKIEVVLAHLDDPEFYSEDQFSDLPPSIKVRPYQWKLLSHSQASSALTYAGMEQPLLNSVYQIPDDGINQFMDCDLWLYISDRFEHPVLPIKPYVLMIYDYLQRYEPIMNQNSNFRFIAAAYSAESIWVTTEFTKQDSIQFTGLSPSKIYKLPMLAPKFVKGDLVASDEKEAYFIWTTNLGLHKNHENALKALQLYYEKFNGQLICNVTGVNTQYLLDNDHFPKLQALVHDSLKTRLHIKIMGELPNHIYQNLLAGAQFLWHAGRVDNGTFSVIESAHLGVPALSSDYPAMREINEQFDLNLSWMDSDSPDEMAKKLKYMELESMKLRELLPSPERLAEQSLERLAPEYWRILEEHL